MNINEASRIGAKVSVTFFAAEKEYCAAMHTAIRRRNAAGCTADWINENLCVDDSGHYVGTHFCSQVASIVY
jgi:hypothetical protein